MVVFQSSLTEDDCTRFVQTYEPDDVNKRNNVMGMEGDVIVRPNF